MSDCGTENIEQTLFLGCSVEKFSCNLGFNEQPTEVSVTLVRDTCAAGNRVYYDPSSSNIRKIWSGADPGFNIYGPNNNEPPRLGAPVYFRFANFEFCGLLQSWVKENTKTDIDVYTIKLVSPVEILEGCQLIIGDYTGPIKGFNIFNIYGFQEVFSAHSLAPSYTDPRFPQDGPVMGSFSGAFGGANANKIGMTWNKIKQGIEILTSSLISARTLGYEEFSEVGRIAFYGGQSNARFGLIPYDEKNLELGLTFGVTADLAYYFLDISELPAVPDNYRVAGPSINLLSIVSQICNDFGMDYYLELVPVRSGSRINKHIKIRTILRNIQPDTTIVQSFIDATEEVIDSSFGRELRNENTTTFLIGGQKQSIVQVDNGKPDPLEDPEETWLYSNYITEDYVRDRIVPYFGKDTYGNAYVLHTTSGSHLENFHLVSNLINNPNSYYINFDFRNRHNWIILDQILPDLVPVTIGEMRSAELGFDNWSQHAMLAKTSVYQYVTGAGLDIDTIFNSDLLLHLAEAGKVQPRDLMNLRAHPVSDQFRYELRQFVDIISNIYQQSKRTFMVRTPWVKARYSIDSTTIAHSYADLDVLYTDESCEGGWTEAQTVLLLGNPSTYLDRMRNTDGSVKSFAVFDLPDDTICTDILTTGSAPKTYTYEYSDGSTRTETVAPGQPGHKIGEDCRAISQTAQTISEFDTADSFAIDRQLIAGYTGSGKILYYAFTQELEPVFLDRINLKSPRVLIQFSQPLDFWSDTPNSKFNANSWGFNSPYLPGGLASNILGNLDNSSEREIALSKVGAPVKEPDAVAIALKSNVHTYGPWKPDNIIEAGPPGQIKFEKQEDLVPWNFGSLRNLATIAQLRANESVTIMSEGEVGNISIHGIPDIPLGAELASLKGLTSRFYPFSEHLVENRTNSYSTVTLADSNGNSRNFNIPAITYDTWNGSFGPTVTSISINFDTEGITTQYGFRTFTPKFGLLSKLNAQRLENRYIYENHRRAQLRYIEESRRVQQRYIQSLRQIGNNLQKDDVKTKHGTPHSVLAGELIVWNSGASEDGSFKRTILSTKDLFEIQNDLTTTGYDHKAIMSLDGLIRPVSMDGDGGLPRYVNNTTGFLATLVGSVRANTAGAIPPFKKTNDSGVYNHEITLDYLNPFSNPVGYLRSALTTRYSGDVGHDIDILARGTWHDLTGVGKSLVMPIDKDGYNYVQRADYADDYRPQALRGPLLIQGWGYDTDGKPVPNVNDIEAFITNSGIFKTTGLGDKFLPNFLRKPQTWPVAPVDLRLDRKRNVWTAPPPYEFIRITLTEDIDAWGSGTATFVPVGAYDTSGAPIAFGKITACDVVGASYTTDSNALAYYDIKASKYNIIGGGGSAAPKSPPVTVLIEEDIKGLTDDCSYTISTGDVVLTQSEKESGIIIKFQDPSGSGTQNLKTKLDTKNYNKRKLSFKYFWTPTKTVITTGAFSITTTNTITLQTGVASSVSGIYIDNWISVNSGAQTARITNYSVNAGLVATITPAWSPSLTSGTYEISTRDLGYKESGGIPQPVLKMVYEDIPGTGADPTTRLYRYDKISAYYEDGKTWECHKYRREDFSDIGESDLFPPTGVDSNFLNKKYRGIVIDGVLVTILCKPLPAPPYPTSL